MGLFMGGSLMVALEVVHTIFSLCGRNGLYQDSEPSENNTFLLYCENGTLHGTVFISRSRSMLCKFFWTLACLGCIITGSIYSVSAIKEFLPKPFENIVHVSSKTVADVQFPSITICSSQMADPWNFQRLVINHVEPLEKDGKRLQPGLFSGLEEFWERVISQTWISDEYMYDALEKNAGISLSDAKLIFSQNLYTNGKHFAPELFGGSPEIITTRYLVEDSEYSFSIEWDESYKFNTFTVNATLYTEDILGIDADQSKTYFLS